MVRHLFETPEELSRDLKVVRFVRSFAKLFKCLRNCSLGVSRTSSIFDLLAIRLLCHRTLMVLG
jgi:hypothetical protein